MSISSELTIKALGAIYLILYYLAIYFEVWLIQFLRKRFEILQCRLVVFIVVWQAEKRVKGLDRSVFLKMQLWRKNGCNKLKEKPSEMEQWFVKNILGKVSERIEVRAIQNISFHLQLYPIPDKKLGIWFWLDDCCT